MYIEVDESSRSQFASPTPSNLVTLNVITSGNRNRWFDIKVSYIPCDSPYKGIRWDNFALQRLMRLFPRLRVLLAIACSLNLHA